MSRPRPQSLLLGLLALLAAAPTSSGQTTPCGGSVGPDVIVADIQGPANYSANGSFEALSLGSVACNMGDADLSWTAGTNNHPVIGGNLYRLKEVGGALRFEHVGRSWLKHGFSTLNQSFCCTTCQTTFGNLLGPGCSDPYTAQRNGNQGNLGPRWQVDPHTGAFPYPPDQPAWTGSTARRLEVAIADLDDTAFTPTRYFGEVQYVSRDDATAGHQNNNVSYKRVAVFGAGATWNFAFAGGTQREQPAIRAWKAFDPLVDLIDVQLPSEGLLILGAKVTELGGGRWSYEYALYNMNSDDAIRSFALPVPAGVAVTNVGFHDLDYRSGDGPGGVNFDGTDWPSRQDAGALIWETADFAANPSANALRWGSTINFRFEADTGPVQGTITLGRFESGLSATVAADVPGPLGTSTGTSFCAGDGSGTPCPSGPGCGSGAAGHGCVNSFGESAWLRAVGDPAANDVVLLVSGIPDVTTVILLRSTLQENGGLGSAFGDGILCVGSPSRQVSASFIEDVEPVLFPIDHTAGPGTFYYQVVYRNHVPTFCTSGRFNLSNGYAIAYP